MKKIPGGLFAGLLFAARCRVSSASALSAALSSRLCLALLLSCTATALSSCLRVDMEALMAAATALSSSSLHNCCFNKKVKKIEQEILEVRMIGSTLMFSSERITGNRADNSDSPTVPPAFLTSASVPQLLVVVTRHNTWRPRAHFLAQPAARGFSEVRSKLKLRVTTFVPPLLPRRVVELKVDLAVLSGLCPVLAVFRSLVGLVVYLRAECVGELLCGAAAFLAQVVTLTEVLTQVLIVTVGSQK